MTIDTCSSLWAAMRIPVAIALVLVSSSPATAEDGTRAGTGILTVTYQVSKTDGYEADIGELPIGSIDTQALNIEMDYHLTDKWTIVAGIPYIRKRYNGTLPHDPLLLNPPRTDVKNVDLGDWNTGFQDFHVGAKYLAKDGAFSVEPFAFYGFPSSDYPFFGHAALGQNLDKLEIGTSLVWYPGLSNAYYRADIAYAFVEETLGVSVNHWNIRAEVGYQFGEILTGRLFTLLKKGSGLAIAADYPGFPNGLTDERWYQHDRLLKHNFMNVGVGLDWAVNDRYLLSGNFMTMTWADQVNIMDHALTLTIARLF